jgi:1-acyl-sn-glycerol-3-phosphate acyltransferase
MSLFELRMGSHERDGVYDHQRLEGRRNFLRFLIDQIAFRFLIKLERIEGLENFPMEGPGIVMINHIAFVDPLVVLGQLPRNVVTLAKEEVYQYPLISIFPKLWDVVLVHRGRMDRGVIRHALKVLDAGEILLIAPEGTRHPALTDPHEGLAYFADRSGVPVIPIAVTGTDGFPTMKRARWKQPGAVVKIGKPFTYKKSGGRANGATLKQMTDDAMYKLADLLPEHLRGEYADPPEAVFATIEG